MKIRIFPALFIVLLLVLRVSGQEINLKNYFISPLNISPVLSGNFGEPRNRHFHTGVDFSTYSEGKDVLAIADGYVSRINISPWGYGNAIYIDHPNGYTSVYAHLSKYNPEIQKFVNKIQYERFSFSIDTLLPPDLFEVKQGDIIAYTGNTGQSEGPHLHFEIRETITEMPINPITTIYSFKDTRSPELSYLVLYPLNENSFINGSNQKQKFKLKKEKDAYYITEKELPQVVGMIGVGLAYVDRMDGTTNRYGAESVKLFEDDQLIYHSSIQKLDFSKQRAKNSMFDYQYYLDESMHVQKLFIEKGNDLSVYEYSVNEGIIYVSSGINKEIKITVNDYNSNTSQLVFKLKGDRNEYPEVSNEGKIFLSADDDMVWIDEEFRLEFDSASLFHDYYLNIEKIKKSKYSNLYKIGEDFIMLKRDFRVQFYLNEDLLKIKDKLFICRIHDGKYRYIESKVNQNFISAESSYFGEFYLWIDTTAPKITPV
ncbi:MAG: M23 family metallopeptidase, partial [Bacteroidales bacterium]|nr:M23 family metallopeptidase [Bacteroidales bacterium]